MSTWWNVSLQWDNVTPFVVVSDQEQQVPEESLWRLASTGLPLCLSSPGQ